MKQSSPIFASSNMHTSGRTCRAVPEHRVLAYVASTRRSKRRSDNDHGARFDNRRRVDARCRRPEESPENSDMTSGREVRLEIDDRLRRAPSRSAMTADARVVAR